MSPISTRSRIVDGSTMLRRCSVRGEMGSCAQWRGGVRGSRGTTTGGQGCRGELLTVGWYGMCGVHGGVKPRDEAMAGGGSTWGKERLERAVVGLVVCKTPAQRSLPRVSQHPSPMGPPENLVVRFLADRTIPHQQRGGTAGNQKGKPWDFVCTKRNTVGSRTTYHNPKNTCQ